MRIRAIVYIFFACLLASCASGVTLSSADHSPAVPARFANADEQSVRNLSRQWWHIYHDETLNMLVEATLRDNPYTQIGVLRQMAARANVTSVAADASPSLNGNAGYSALRTSETSPLGDVLNGGTIHGNKFTAGFDTAWQFDVWKRVHHAVEAAEAQAAMGQTFAGMIEMVLSTEVATTYWQFRAADAELKLLTSIRDERAQTVQLLAARKQTGVASELDWTRARKELSDVDADIEEARKKRTLAEHELATLVTKPLAEFSMGDDLNYVFPSVPQITPGLPATVLARRPDLVDSAYSVRMLLAQRDVAEAALYPSIGLTGNFGLASTELKDLLRAQSRQFTLGPIGISMPIFDAGRIRSNLAVADARYQEAVNLHQSRLLIAMREVDDALTEIHSYNEQTAMQQQSLDAARQVEALTTSRYKAGFINYVDVSDARREELATERKLLQVRAQGLLASVKLVSAIGGGWSMDGAN